MIVTRFKYPLEDTLVAKLDLIVNRVAGKGKKKDALITVEGPEGDGKTTMSVAIGYYLSEQTSRPFSVDNLFFDVKKMMKFAQETENQIIVYDEPALQVLSTDHGKREVKNFMRLLMMARKKRHIWIVNITKFFKFPEYIVVDRAVGMIHIYTRDEAGQSRFTYIHQKCLEPLYRDWTFKKLRNYKKYSSKFVRGTFPDILNQDYANNVLKEFNSITYEKRKDEAIASIGDEADKPIDSKRIKKVNEQLKIAFAKIGKFYKLSSKEISDIIDIPASTFRKWTQLNDKDTENEPKEGVYA